jgi:IS30 family transposase
MDIFRLLYVEKRRTLSIAAALNRRPPSIIRKPGKGMDKGMFAESRHLEARRNQRPRLKITGETWNMVKPQLEKRWSEEVAKWLKKEYPCYAVSGKTIYNYVFFHMSKNGEKYRK